VIKNHALNKALDILEAFVDDQDCEYGYVAVGCLTHPAERVGNLCGNEAARMFLDAHRPGWEAK
jgi:hypothetical protein